MTKNKTFLETWKTLSLLINIVSELVPDLFNPFFTKSLTASVCKSDKMD